VLGHDTLMLAALDHARRVDNRQGQDPVLGHLLNLPDRWAADSGFVRPPARALPCVTVALRFSLRHPPGEAREVSHRDRGLPTPNVKFVTST